MERDRAAHNAVDRISTASLRWSLLEIALIVAVFFAATGDRPPNVNESHYLCRFKHYWDPAWCRGDLFLESPDTQLVLIWLFGWVTRFVSLTATAWIGRVLAWIAIATAWHQLSWRIIPRRFASVLSAALFLGLNHYLHLAGEWVVGGVEAKCFAYALVLLALRGIIDERWNRAWLLLGGATALHPIVGGWSVLLCAGVWIVAVLAARSNQRLLEDHSPNANRTTFTSLLASRMFAMLPGLIAGGLVGLIGIVPALSLTWGVPAEIVNEAARIYVFDRLPHHLAPLTLTAEVPRRLAGHAILLATMFVLWLLQRNSRAISDEAVARSPANSLEARQELDPSLPNDLSADDPPSLSPLHAIVLFAIGAAALAGIGFALEIGLANHPLVAAKLLRYYWFRLTDFAASMAVAFQLTVLVVAALERRRAWALPALAAAIVLAAWFPVAACWDRLANDNSPSDAKIPYFKAWVEVCDWIRANTPSNALFITPRANVSFKWRTERPEVANRKDIPQDARGIVEWAQRLKDIYTIQYAGKPLVLDSVCSLGTERVRELANKYHAQYVLSDRLELLDLPVAFANEDYVVYRIEDRNAGDGP